MKPFITLLTLLAALGAEAQLFTFGEPVPLANTRYGMAQTYAKLQSNGRELFAFWPTKTGVRVTKVVEGEKRGGRTVIRGGAFYFDVAWSGTQFLAAAETGDGKGAVQLLDAEANPIGEQVSLTYGDRGLRVASNGRSFLVASQNYDAYRYDLAVRKVEADGRVGAPQIVFRASNNTIASFDMASNGNGYLLLIATYDDVFVVRLDANGVKQSQSSIYTSGGETGRNARVVEIATNGTTYLATWMTVQGDGIASFLDTNGVAGERLSFDDEVQFNSDFSLIWTGTLWGVGYALETGGVRVTHIDETARRVVGHDDAAGAMVSLGMLSSRVVAARRHTASPYHVVVSQVPFESEAQPLTFAAASQVVHVTAASHDATLVVWTEEFERVQTLRAGRPPRAPRRARGGPGGRRRTPCGTPRRRRS